MIQNKAPVSNKQLSSVAIGNTGSAVPPKSQESKHIKTSVSVCSY